MLKSHKVAAFCALVVMEKISGDKNLNSCSLVAGKIDISNSNQSVHGLLIRSVNLLQNYKNISQSLQCFH